MKWIWAIVAVFIISGVVMTLHFGLVPRPIKQIDPTTFDRPETIGVASFQRLHPEWHKFSVMVVGSSPWLKNYEKPWLGFVKAAQAKASKFSLIIEHKTLKPIPIGDIERLTFSSLEDFPLAEVQQKIRQGQKVLIHTTAFSSSHLMKKSLSRWLDTELGHRVLAVSQQVFVVDDKRLGEIQPKCDAREMARNGTSLGCEGVRFSKTYFRKKLPKDRYIAGMERHGMSDYILFIYEP